MEEILWILMAKEASIHFGVSNEACCEHWAWPALGWPSWARCHQLWRLCRQPWLASDRSSWLRRHSANAAALPVLLCAALSFLWKRWWTRPRCVGPSTTIAAPLLRACSCMCDRSAAGASCAVCACLMPWVLPVFVVQVQAAASLLDPAHLAAISPVRRVTRHTQIAAYCSVWTWRGLSVSCGGCLVNLSWICSCGYAARSSCGLAAGL